jgi:hypothetical protein
MPAPTAQATKATRATAAAAPFPRSAVDFTPDEYKLKCCICRKLFRGGGHNPGGFSVRYRNKRTGEVRTYRYPHSKWGSRVHRCCDSCDARVSKRLRVIMKRGLRLSQRRRWLPWERLLVDPAEATRRFAAYGLTAAGPVVLP